MSEDETNADANFVERAGHDSKMALLELKKDHKTNRNPLRSIVAILKVKRSPIEIGIDYPKWTCGPGRCHYCALYVLSPDAAREAKEMKLKYSDVQKITALADRYHGQNKHIFRLYDGPHWVALTDRLYVDDNNAYVVKNYPLAFLKLSLMNGCPLDGLNFPFDESLADQPSLTNLNYSMSPSTGDLFHKHGLGNLKLVKDLRIENKGVGCIHWKKPVDITGHDLNVIVKIRKFQFTVSYEALTNNPAVWEKLNGPASLSIYQVNSPPGMDVPEFVERVKKRLSATDMTFVDYDAESKILTVSVEHIGSHELSLDNLEDE